MRPPIQEGEIYIRCVPCGILGWTVDEPDEPWPFCPYCGRATELAPNESDETPDVVIIDGAPIDPAHHLTI